MTRIFLLIVAAGVALLPASVAGQRQARQLKAARLVLPAGPARTPAVNRVKAPQQLSAATLRKLALEAGMPRAYSLSGKTTSLTARRMYVDGAAYLAGDAYFNTRFDSPHLTVNSERGLKINFHTPKDNALVLIAVHGQEINGNGAIAKLMHDSLSPDPQAPGAVTTTPVAPVIPFAVQCGKADWYAVYLTLEGLPWYRIDRVDVSLFSES